MSGPSQECSSRSIRPLCELAWPVRQGRHDAQLARVGSSSHDYGPGSALLQSCGE